MIQALNYISLNLHARRKEIKAAVLHPVSLNCYAIYIKTPTHIGPTQTNLVKSTL